MRTKPPIVPSTEALRILRRLAFSIPAVFVGGAASTCGLVLINRDAYQKIKVVEQIAHTKRTLHTISKGRGASRTASLFAAAERGEDISLTTGRSTRRRQARRHFTIPVEKLDEDAESIEQLQDSKAPTSNTLQLKSAVPQEFQTIGNQALKHHQKKSKPLQNKTSPHLVQALGRATRFKGFRNTDEAQRPAFSSPDVMRAKESQPGRTSENKSLLGPGAFQNRSFAHRDQKSTDEQKSSRFDSRPTDHYGTLQHTDSTLSKANPASDITLQYSQLPVENAMTNGIQFREWPMSPTDHFEAFQCGTSRGNSDEINLSYAAEQPDSWSPLTNRQVGRKQSIAQSKEMLTPQEGYGNLLDFQYEENVQSEKLVGVQSRETIDFNLISSGSEMYSDASNLSTSEVLKLHDPKKTSKPLNDEVLKADANDNKGSTHLDGEKLAYLLYQMNQVCRKSRKAGRELWVRTIHACETAIPNADWALAELLYRHFYKRFSFTISPGPLRTLGRELLERNPESEFISTILFPQVRGKIPEAGSKVMYRTAHLYLCEFCLNNTDPNFQILEFRKIESLAGRLGLRLDDDLIVPVIRSLCSNKHAMMAKDLIESLEANSDVEVSAHIKRVLVLGLASSSEWDLARNVLEDMHGKGYSRSRAVGFSLAFNGFFQSYAIQKPVTQTYDLLIHAIRFWGLVPTSVITTTLIESCLRSRRYDLIREWSRVAGETFPVIDSSAKSVYATWHIAEVWKEISASCVEVEKTCRALAYEAMTDPFTTEFKASALEAVEQNLLQKLHIAKQSLDVSNKSSGIHPGHSQGLTLLLQEAGDLISASKDRPIREFRKRHLIEDLKSQVESVNILLKMFSGQEIFKGHKDDLLLRTESAQTSNPATKVYVESLEEVHPDLVNAESLPPWKILFTLVQDHYTGSKKTRQPPGHALIKYLVKKLRQVQRYVEAIQILRFSYDSQSELGQRGQPFDVELFTAWLRLVYEMKSSRLTRDLLWAVSDSARHVEMSWHFILLVKMVMGKSDKSRWRNQSHEEWEEIYYLSKRLEKLYVVKKGNEKFPAAIPER